MSYGFLFSSPLRIEMGMEISEHYGFGRKKSIIDNKR
jgi:hypothetical protein